MAAPRLLSASLGTLTGSDNATGSLTCFFDIEMSQSPLNVTSNFNFTPSLTVASASATALGALAWYPTDDCSGTSVFNSGSGGTVLSGTLGNGAGSNEPVWDCASGTGSLDYQTSDWVDYGTDPAWDIFGSPWTISTWINPDALTNYGAIIGKTSASPGTADYTFMCVMRPVGYIGIWAGGWKYGNTSGIIQTGVWQHITWVFDGTDTTYYYNGVSDGSDATSYSDNSARHVYTGQWLGSTYSFDGKIDNVSVFTSALSSAQVAALYAKGRDGSPMENPTDCSLTVTGIDTSQGYILDVNSNIVDASAGLSCVPNSASFIAASGRGVSNDSTLFKFAGEGVDRTRIISRKPGVISNLSAQADRTITITTPGTLTIEYFQRVWDIDNSQWCYYTQTAINASPGTTDTQPNNSGNIISSSVVQILEIY